MCLTLNLLDFCMGSEQVPKPFAYMATNYELKSQFLKQLTQKIRLRTIFLAFEYSFANNFSNQLKITLLRKNRVNEWI